MLKDVVKGIMAYFGAFTLIRKLKLGKYFAIPILISFLVGGLVFFVAYTLSDNIGAVLARLWIWDWGKETFGTIGTVLGWIAIFSVSFILYRHIVMALASPFMSPVSEKIEAHFHKENDTSSQLIHNDTSFGKLLARGIRINLRNITKELFFTIILLLLSLIPMVNVITTVFLFLLQAYYAGFANMDYTLERHYKYKESIRFVQKNRGVAIGNGLIFVLLLFVPIIGFIVVLPLSVTASSVKTLEKIYDN